MTTRQLVLTVCALAAGSSLACAETLNVPVATVHGSAAFDLMNGGNEIYIHPQPDTDYEWNHATASDVRDGMKTFIASDIAYGQRLDSLAFSFEYNTGDDPVTGYTGGMSYPTINIIVTDGTNFGIWTPKGTNSAFSTTTTSDPDWNLFTADFTTGLTDATTYGKLYEATGGLALPTWADLKSWTIAGFYSGMNSPEGGWAAWDDVIWGELTDDASDLTPNTYGLTLVWGDSAGGEDGDGDGGVDAVTGAGARSPARNGRQFRDFDITVGGTTYDAVFVPEPASAALLALAGLGLLARRTRGPRD